MNHLFRRFRRDIVGLIWLATATFLGLSLYSYNPQDPSFNTLGESLKVANYCGYFGSFLADLLYQGLGLTAWLFLVAALRLSWRSFQGAEVRLKSFRWLWAGLLFLTSSSLGALYFADQRYFSGQIMIGGLLGHLTASSLIQVFNFAGVAIILWTTAIVLVVFYTERPLNELFRLPLTFVGFIASGLKSLAAQEIWRNGLMSLRVGWSKILKPAKMIPAFASNTTVRSSSFQLNNSSSAGAKEARFFRIQQDESSATEKRFEVDHTCEDQPKEKSSFPLAILKEVIAPQLGKNQKRKVNLKTKVQRRIENWELPKISLLEDPPVIRKRVDEKEIKQKSHLLVNKLEQFNVRGQVTGVKPGPAVTMFEFKPNVDVKISKITELADDLSLALSSESVRIIAPIPGRDVVGIETSNSQRETVYLKDVLAEENFWDEDQHLPIALGREANGQPKIVDLRKMPHLLVAGSTGSGKSVFTVSLLVGLIFRHSPKTLRLILVDPKQVDLAAFSEIPHLLMPPIRDSKKAIGALRWAIKEMEKRYRSMSKFGARGLESFNKMVSKLDQEEIQEHEQFHENAEGAKKLEDYYFTPQPYIVIVVEEFGDLMAVDKGNVEQAVVRLAQMARACGIHLVLAMQSPRKDVVTGLIKTNIPGRISFKVASKMDSRIILDESGAERLLTRGDMLFLAPGFAKPMRHHGPWLPDEDINEVTAFWRSQGEPEYNPLALRSIEGSGGGFDLPGEDQESQEEEYDERYDEVLAYISTQKEVSASLLQRRFRLGYPRAARLIEIFEQERVVGPANGSKPRQVLINELK